MLVQQVQGGIETSLPSSNYIIRGPRTFWNLGQAINRDNSHTFCNLVLGRSCSGDVVL